jgi:Cu/Zn superoxide dismutase
MISLRTGALALCAAFLASASAFGATMPNKVTVQMKALNGSGESGTATLTQESDGVKVVVDLKKGTAGAQPTHIHVGTCGNISKAPEYPLSNTVGGKGDSLVKGVKLSDLLKGKYAINVHKSTSDLATYVSCGNIAAK